MATVKKGKEAALTEWEIEDALRTLERAAEIKKDAKLCKAVNELAKKKLLSIADLANETAKEN